MRVWDEWDCSQAAIEHSVKFQKGVDGVALREDNGFRMMVDFNTQEDVGLPQVLHVEPGTYLSLKQSNVTSKNSNVVNVQKKPCQRRGGPKKYAGVTDRNEEPYTDEPRREAIVPSEWSLF
jgi:hypothetical protein